MVSNISNLFYISLLASFMPQYAQAGKTEASEPPAGQEHGSASLAMARARALANIQEQLLPNLNLLQLEANEFLSRVNGAIYNMTFNETFEEEMMCHNGQNAIANLVTMILYALVCIIGLFGNTLVIYVVLRFSKMQTVTNIYILNLAIADECFLIGIPILLYTMQIGRWPFDDYVCKAYMVSTSITQFTSSIFLLIMSADRYIAVCHPISSPRYRTPFVSKLVSGFAWLTSVLLMLPVILFANTVQSNEDHVSCNIKWPEAQNTQSGTTFILYTLTLGFATPLTFILIFYFLVIRKLHTVGPKQKSKEKKRSHRKVTKLVLTVITVYILCWLPYWISQLALIYSSPSKCASRLEITIFLLAGCLGYSNSAMNPILYAFLSDNFKKSFLKACTCATRKDVNAQLQLENSLFPKFGKNRQSDRLFSPKKAKQKKLLVTRNNNAANMHNAASTTTTTTTNTTTTSNNSAANQIVAYTDPQTSNFPTLKTPLMTANQQAAGNVVSGTNATVLLVPDTSCADVLEHQFAAEGTTKPIGTDMSCKAPVLHTDL
ncbi:somatostatin receptor type 5-like [Bactrocera neohumeralis]|uniref:somatostatin receptor type 5-like n=1 Tax=Bactrocera neohumeralis TaxID=98809 RepID=UPI002166815B|nr:somatostatin receptor type 5-like [Bactrocera neohumeralis]XP_050333213.1 somatostatin receptor type 5-like [Bactrocera neohumeralis]XP_050333214.1 somatostatin receptor type 5-like [Bactrocera neohumeralis]XP_050333215.1 somatostatin receptor type 5-like [Bactrocera neohumeralis]XP_050333216.1 somatostatin receptor type 5-like [Bactrocera neohumeralis]XP_050333217.1 somatostatin receptor type 5-like [Bactrocera neohumeralis]